MTTPYAVGMDYGVGLNSLTGATRGTAVTWSGDPQDVTGSQGQQVNYSIQRIESLSDLQTALGVKVDASATYGMFSGSAKVDFVNKSAFHDYSIFLLVYVQVTNSFRRILTPALTPQAQQMISQGNFAQFLVDFGDTFISGLSTGGEYIVVLEVHTYSQSDEQSLTSQLNASGGLGAFSGSLSAQFSNSIKSINQSHSLQFHVFQAGGDTSQVTDPDQIVAKGNSFPLTVAGDQSVPYSVLPQDYGVLGIQLPNETELANQRASLADMWDQRNLLTQLLGNIQYVLAYPGEFEPPIDVQALNAVASQITSNLNMLQASASKCAGDATQCALPVLSIPTVNLPQRRAALSVLTTSLPAATCGSPYMQGRLEATGGVGSATWALTSGSLPSGLSLNPDGQIVGTPGISQPEAQPFTVTATDQVGSTAVSQPLIIYLIGRQAFYTNAGSPIEQDSSGKGDITKTYVVTPPAGSVIVRGTVNIDPQPDTQRPSGPWRIPNQVITPNAVQFDLFTSAAGGFPVGHHSGHVIVIVSFTYQTV